jgi:hypothetical protein
VHHFVCCRRCAGFAKSFLTYWEPIQDGYTTSGTYHLLFYQHDEDYNARYIVFECDRFDLLCSEVRNLARGNGITPDVEQIALIPHPDGYSVSLKINGEIVETFS